MPDNGTEKRNIFSSNTDYERFLSLINLCISTSRFDLDRGEEEWKKEAKVRVSLNFKVRP